MVYYPDRRQMQGEMSLDGIDYSLFYYDAVGGIRYDSKIEADCKTVESIMDAKDHKLIKFQYSRSDANIENQMAERNLSMQERAKTRIAWREFTEFLKHKQSQRPQTKEIKQRQFRM